MSTRDPKPFRTAAPSGAWSVLPGLLGGASVGAALTGGVQAVGVLAASGGGPTLVDTAALVVANGVVIGLLVVVALMVPAAVFGGFLVRVGGGLPRWVGFWLGLALGLCVQLSVASASGWEAAPGGWTCLAALALAPASVVIASWLPAGRARIFGIFLAIAPGLVWVELGRHAPAGGTDPPVDAPDVLLVTVEGLRGTAGPAPQPRLPVLAALAEDGVRFDSARTTRPEGVAGAASALSGDGAAAGEAGPTVPELLHLEGWKTGAFLSRASVGTERIISGFDLVNRGAVLLLAGEHTVAGALVAATGWRAAARRGDRETTDAAVAWIREARIDRFRPLFLWVHLAGAAPPGLATPPWDTAYYQGDARDPSRPSVIAELGLVGESAIAFEGVTDPNYVIAQHSGAASAADEQVGRLLAALEDGGSRPKVVVVAGVSGIALGDGGLWLTTEAVPTAATASVPVVVRAAGRLPRGATSASTVSIADVATTTLELVGVSAEGVGGRSLVPVAFGRHGQPFTATAAVEGPGLVLWGDHWSFSTATGDDAGELALERGEAGEEVIALLRSISAGLREGEVAPLAAEEGRLLRKLGAGL